NGNYNLRTELSSLKERNLYAFYNSLFCDVEFTVLDSNGEQVTLKAHKYVLAIGSPVFEAMFYGELAEIGPTIDLPDCTKEGLQEMLHYVYSDEVNLTGSNVMDVLYAAQKYMMPFLENKCSEYIQKELRPEDVFIVLPQAQQMKNEKAELCCWNVIDFEAERAVTSEPFLDISRELLIQVLARETLHVEEIELFKAVDKWASNQIKDEKLKHDGATKREVLGEEVIRLVRFPIMSHHEFAQFVIDSNILVLAETNEFIKVLGSATTSEAVFTAKKRDGQWNEKWSPNRFRSIKGNGNEEVMNKGVQRHCIQIQVNKPVYLAGVTLFGAQFQVPKIKLTIAKGMKGHVYNAGTNNFGVIPSCDTRKTLPMGFAFGSSTPPSMRIQENTRALIFGQGSTISGLPSPPSPVFKHTYAELTFDGTAVLIDGSYHGFKLLFEGLPNHSPVPLEPNEWYFIQAELSGQCSSFAGSEGQDAVKCDDITIKFKNADQNSTTVQTGQFPSLLLKRKVQLLSQEPRSVIDQFQVPN
ncbi:BTB/POZ domain-containing protein 6-B-like, partial [Actinia tenebrosa]|uniref:BTB/POZ domain-containing protein 6-B-like n=1 Tax=Actinia tenebrosa TaxID=6105 RepID=A0A6P8IJH4_ACTTE